MNKSLVLICLPLKEFKNLSKTIENKICNPTFFFNNKNLDLNKKKHFFFESSYINPLEYYPKIQNFNSVYVLKNTFNNKEYYNVFVFLKKHGYNSIYTINKCGVIKKINLNFKYNIFFYYIYSLFEKYLKC